MQNEVIGLQLDFIVLLLDIDTCGAQMPECTIVTTKDHSTLCIFYSSYILPI